MNLKAAVQLLNECLMARDIKDKNRSREEIYVLDKCSGCCRTLHIAFNVTQPVITSITPREHMI
jgi:hypothetical protein